MKTKKSGIKKMQNGGGTYITTKKGRVGRTYGIHGPYESIDTTGYSKGKKDFKLKSSYPSGKTKTEPIKREDVPSKIDEFKKGAKKVVNLKNGGKAKVKKK